MLNLVLVLTAAASQASIGQAAASQGDAPGAGLPVVTASPVQVASPQAPLSVKMRPSVMPIPPVPAPVYLPRPVTNTPASRSPRPMGASDAWVTTADYPKAALKAEQTGVVLANLTVAPTGRVTGCAINVSSGFPLLDAASCRVLSARALFTPATDEAGNPTAATYLQRVRWALPDVLPYPARPSRLDVRIIIEADGTQSHCEIIRTEGQLVADRAKLGPIPCSAQKTKPYTDASGKPLRKTVTYSEALIVEDAAP